MISRQNVCFRYLHGSKLTSFRFSFHAICFIWTLMRFVFWITYPFHLSNFLLLYDLPILCQIVMFGFILLYYVQVLYGRQWRAIRRTIMCSVGVALTTLTTLIYIHSYDNADNADNWHLS